MSTCLPTRPWLASLIAAFSVGAVLSGLAPAAAETPLVYVRYPRVGPTPTANGAGWFGNTYDPPFFDWVNRCFGNPGSTGAPACPPGYAVPDSPPLPEVRDLYRVIAGGDIVLRRADGSERVVVEHDESLPAEAAVGSVLDLAVSPDAEWIVWAQVANARAAGNAAGVGSRIDLFKAFVGNEADGRFGRPACLTCARDFAFDRFSGWDPEIDEAWTRYAVKAPVFVAPVWLPDGRILFGSTVAAEAISGLPNFFEERVDFFARGELEPALQLWTMEADGAGWVRITPSLPTRLQHPTLLGDGRLVATSWEMAFRRRIHNGFSLVEMGLDGSGFRQFAGRHQTRSVSQHFAAAMPNGEVCAAEYYNGQTWGFGSLLCHAADPPGPDFSDDPAEAWRQFLDENPLATLASGLLSTSWTTVFGSFFDYLDIANRQERRGSRYLTPHMSNFDTATADWSGRVTQPAPGPGGSVYVVWSPGAVNKAEGGGLPADAMPRPNAGIYRLAGGLASPALDPATDLIAVVDTIEFHEMWPRPLVPWGEIFGSPPPHAAQPTGEPWAWLQAASVRSRLTRSDGIDYARGAAYPAIHWNTQGTEAGLTGDDDLVGIRILAVVPQGLSRPWSPDFPEATSYQLLNRSWWSPALDRVVILGEVPVLERGADGRLIENPEDLGSSGVVQPDTSYRVRVPAGVAIFQQGLDRRGLATSTETTWQVLASGERKTCSGCHLRTAEVPAFEHSRAGRGSRPEHDVTAVTPLFEGVDAAGDPTVGVVAAPTVAVEWHRDVAPVLSARCARCHGGSEPAAGLVLDDSWDTYRRLAVPRSDDLALPQISPWTRLMQARQSRLVWYLWGERLDGRPDAGDPDTRGGFDWTFDRATVAEHHPPADLTDAERRRVARWVDIGMPIDLATWHQTTDPANAVWKSRRGYLVDDLPPSLVLGGLPWSGAICRPPTLLVGVWDDQGLAVGSLAVSIDGGAPRTAALPSQSGIVSIPLTDLGPGRYLITVVVEDLRGNRSETERRLEIDPTLPECSSASDLHEDGFESGSPVAWDALRS